MVMQSALVQMEHSGLLPEGVDRSSLADVGQDLLECLERVWSQAAGRTTGVAGRRCQRVAARLGSWRQRGARLTYGIPGVADKRWEAWLGARLAWWPGGIPDGRMVGLISSRLGRDLELRRRWFTALRMACMNLEHRRMCWSRLDRSRRSGLFGGPENCSGCGCWSWTSDDRACQDPGRWGRQLLEADPDAGGPCPASASFAACGEFCPEPALTETPLRTVLSWRSATV
jgi:hypothetical protein